MYVSKSEINEKHLSHFIFSYGNGKKVKNENMKKWTRKKEKN